MSFDLFEQSIFEVINENACRLEGYLSADVISYHGGLNPI